MQRRNHGMRGLSIFSCILLLLVSTLSYAKQEHEIKIAVASESKQPTSDVSSLAGRSPYYLIFDSTGKLIEGVKNPYKEIRGGAGTSIAHYLSEKGVTIIIAETFGNKMINAMKSKGMTYYEFKGIANDAVTKILSSK
jgi:predicted Fe-Mo cluster-binding NifX family protein